MEHFCKGSKKWGSVCRVWQTEEDESWGKKVRDSEQGEEQTQGKQEAESSSCKNCEHGSRRGVLLGEMSPALPGQAWPSEGHVGADTCPFSLTSHPSLHAACAAIWTQHALCSRPMGLPKHLCACWPAQWAPALWGVSCTTLPPGVLRTSYPVSLEYHPQTSLWQLSHCGNYFKCLSPVLIRELPGARPRFYSSFHPLHGTWHTIGV